MSVSQTTPDHRPGGRPETPRLPDLGSGLPLTPLVECSFVLLFGRQRQKSPGCWLPPPTSQGWARLNKAWSLTPRGSPVWVAGAQALPCGVRVPQAASKTHSERQARAGAAGTLSVTRGVSLRRGLGRDPHVNRVGAVYVRPGRPHSQKCSHTSWQILILVIINFIHYGKRVDPASPQAQPGAAPWRPPQPGWCHQRKRPIPGKPAAPLGGAFSREGGQRGQVSRCRPETSQEEQKLGSESHKGGRSQRLTSRPRGALPLSLEWGCLRRPGRATPGWAGLHSSQKGNQKCQGRRRNPLSSRLPLVQSHRVWGVGSRQGAAAGALGSQLAARLHCRTCWGAKSFLAAVASAGLASAGQFSLSGPAGGPVDFLK